MNFVHLFTSELFILPLFYLVYPGKIYYSKEDKSQMSSGGLPHGKKHKNSHKIGPPSVSEDKHTGDCIRIVDWNK